MKKQEKEKTSNLDLHKWIVLGIIIIFILIGSLANILFPDSAFATIIDSSIGKFFDVVSLFKNNYINILESIAVILFIGILYYVISVLIKLLTKNNTRKETIGILIISMTKFAFMVIALILVLSAWNVPTPTLLAGAGIAGLAISFGAQGLLEDVFAGLSIIFEKQFVVGNFVEVGDFRGEVLEIGPRNTRIKNIYGNILIIANSDIREIVNLSEELSFAISEVSIEYSADLDKVEDIIKQNLPLIKEKIPQIVQGPIYDGVDQLGDSAVIVRVIAHCEEKDRLKVRRLLNKELKILLDKNGITIPFPQLVIHQGNQNKE
ncbi:mechanosensitive ion channel family protein [Mariniplasma anaerobium]|uniref:Putative MscS family protein YkuT n=1 Tax=Mariniplasma anaerobium TaxID=2735436 RepID=A0A7U9TGJ8_9MOLU|nr:mechanosensitive ion channel family protein [Mariniplasma anaerobium]BCR35734.1 putative MscS family protein YkuT [Mariniplasma anaerobium]